ncbi:hypothetical protein VKT23_020035 [Stygiomarasmius scandens]|uniref:Uncharacterized protein n=1 Tax=Marasmiellus scandens TaxID=2682957 RepID=A0ABR1IJW3_9AGAR
MSHVQPKRGRFAWSEVDDEDAAFLSDPRQGCTPQVHTSVIQSSSQINYRFYLVLNGEAPGIYFDWGYLKASIDLTNDMYKGFNNKAELLTAYRWFCLHYHRHPHDYQYDDFINPFSSPPLSPVALPNHASPSPKKAVPSIRSSSPTKHASSSKPKGTSSTTKSSKNPQLPPIAADPFTKMGSAFDNEESVQPQVQPKQKGKMTRLRHWVVVGEGSAMITTDRTKAQAEYRRLVVLEGESTLMFGTSDLEEAMRLYDSGAN